MNQSETEIIWLIARQWIDGMSREEAIAYIAEEHGINQEELYKKLL
ncbi:hypothetical protein [Brevibacillus panacihumi]